MKPTSVLTKIQTEFLNQLSQSRLAHSFYLTGGTALVGFYLPYRVSDDLDFFSQHEVDLIPIVTFLKSIKNKIGYQQFDINTSFNRNLIFLKLKDSVLKTEFTYYPFTQIKKPTLFKKIQIDSAIDIAANKLFTIYQKPRSRDFMDLFMLCQKEKITIKELTKMAKVKFDWHIDPIKLGTQFLFCTKLKDYPNLTIDLKEKDWQAFFLNEAKKLQGSIFT